MVRQAIAHAIDKKALVTRVLRGYGSEGTSFIPSLYPKLQYVPAAGEALNFDLAAATSSWRRQATGTPTATRCARCPAVASRCGSA